MRNQIFFPGDLLTLAEEAPAPARRAALLWQAAEMLSDMRRFDAALAVLDDLLALDDEHRDAVAPAEQVLRTRMEALAQRGGGPTESGARFGKVVVASGHMTDAPGRAAKGLGERFPQRKEGAVRERLAAQLDRWAVGAGDLAVCGGARGADILFAELCADRGAEIWFFLPLPDAEFLEKSVRHPEGDWEQRFFDLRARDNVETFSQPDRLKSPPKGTSVFARNNLWMLNTARVEADDPSRLYAVLVWDEKPTGDGPGGTSDFAARVRQLGGRLAPVINPTTL